MTMTNHTINIAAITTEGLTWSTQVSGEQTEVVDMATKVLVTRVLAGLDENNNWDKPLLVATIAWPMGTQVFDARMLEAVSKGYAVRFNAGR